MGILTGLDAGRQAVKGAEGKEPVGSMREVGARKSFRYSSVMVRTVVGIGIRTGASARVASPSRRE